MTKRILLVLFVICGVASAQPVPTTWRPPSNCTSGQVLTWSGFSWGCGTGTGVTGTGTTNRVTKWTSSSVIGNTAFPIDDTSSTLTLGDSGLDAVDVNADAFKIGGTSDGWIYFNNGGWNYLYATNGEATGYINNVGYNSGTTQFRNLIIGDGKGATACELTGSSKTLNCIGGIQINGVPVTAGLSGSGTTNRVTKWTSSGVLGDTAFPIDDATALLTLGNDIADTIDFNGRLIKIGSDDGYTFIDQDTIGFGYAQNAEYTGIINWKGYQNGVTQFRNLRIDDGKSATIASFTGSDKTVDFNGDVTKFGSVDGAAYFYTNELNVGYAVDADTSLFLNYRGYAAANTHFRDLIVADGKTNTACTLTASTKIWNCVGGLQINGAAVPSGSGSTGQLVRWATSSTQGDSSWYDDGAGTTRFGASDTRFLTLNTDGVVTMRYDDNSLLRSLNITNQGITAAGHGIGINLLLANGGAAYEAGVSLDALSENTTYTGATADATASLKVSVNGTLTERLSITSAGIGTFSGGTFIVSGTNGAFRVLSNDTVAAEVGGISVRGVSNANKKLVMGYDESADYSWILSVLTGTSRKPLKLLATSTDIDGNATVSGNLSSGDAAGDVFDHNGDVAKFGSVDGAAYFQTNELNVGYAVDADTSLFLNYRGYAAGSTRFRDLVIADGKNATACTVTASTKTLSCVGGLKVGSADVAVVNGLGSTNSLVKFTSTTQIGNSGWTDTGSASAYGGNVTLGDAVGDTQILNGSVRLITADAGTGHAASSWATGGWTVFGPNASSGTGAAFGIGYSSTSDEAHIATVAPSGGWKPTKFFGSGWTFRAADNSANDVAIDSAGGVSIAKTLAVDGSSRFGDNPADTVIIAQTNAALDTATASSRVEVTTAFQSLITLGETGTATGNPAITLYRTAAGSRTGVAARIANVDQFDFRIQQGSSAAYGAETYTDRLVIDSSGRVGIGDSSPTEGHLVVGDASSSKNIVLKAGSGWADYEMWSGSSNGGSLLWSDDSGSTNAGEIFYYHGDDSMTFKTAATTRMTVVGGSVNIGTDTTPDYTLAVEGSFGADGHTTLGDGSGDIMDANGDLSMFGTTGGDGIFYIQTDTLNFGYSQNAAWTGYINYRGYQYGTTQFRNLIIADGKQAAVATFTGSDKSASFAGNVTAQVDFLVMGATQLGDAGSDRVESKGNFGPSGSDATINACGTGPSISGEAQNFQVTIGSGTTTCVVNFNRTFNSAPFCVFSAADNNASADVASVTGLGDSPYITSTTTTVTITVDGNVDGSAKPVYNVWCPDRY